MAGEGAELKLRVSLDLTSLRRQLNTIGTQLAGQALPLQIRLDRTTISKEFRLLDRYVGRKKFNIEINTNLKDEIGKAQRLAEAINNVQRASQKIPGVSRAAGPGGLQGLILDENTNRSQLQALYKFAREAKLPFEQLARGAASSTQELRRVLFAGFGDIGDDVKAGISNSLKDASSTLAKLANEMGEAFLGELKAVLGIASPSKETKKIGKDTGEGLILGMESSLSTIQSRLAPYLDKLLDFLRRSGYSLGAAFGKSFEEGRRSSIGPGIRGGALGAAGGAVTGATVGGAKALGAGVTGGLAKLGGMGAFGIASQLGRLGIGDTAGLTGFVQEISTDMLYKALEVGGEAALAGLLGVGGVAALTGFAKGTSQELLRQLYEGLKSQAKALLDAGQSKVNVDDIVKVVIREVAVTLLGSAARQIKESASRSLPAIDWPALPPGRSISAGPSSTGRLLTASADPRMLGAAAAPAGLLPSISQTTARRTSIATGLQAIFAAGGPTFPEEPPGKLALTPEALKRRVDAILAEYFKVVAVKVEETFEGAEFNILRVLGVVANTLEEAANNAKRARIDHKVDMFFAQVERAVQAAQARAMVAASGATPRAGMRFGGAPERLMLPAAGESGGMFGGGARITGRGVTPRGGFPTAGPLFTGKQGPANLLPPDYFENVKRFNASLEVARNSMAKFRASQLPFVGGLQELAGEFGMATKQVLLYGAAYKGLAFITSLPGQIINAAKGQQQFANAMQVATQETNTFAKEMLYVDNVQRAFGLNLETTRSGFTRLYASMAPSGFDSGSIEKLFTGISAASAALQLTPDKAERVIYAFGQMASKGQVMSEELKGQLGDVLPGALAIFAKAAGKSVKEFNKEIEDGIYSGSKFRELMAGVTDELIRRFGTAAQVAGRSLQGLLNTVQGEFVRTLEALSPLANTAAQSILGPLGGALRQFSTAARVAMGETTMIAKQIADAQQVVKDLKEGGADINQIRGAEQSLAALQARQEQFNVALQDPAVRKQAEEIKIFIGEMVKLGTVISNVVNIVGGILNPILTFLGANLTTVVTVIGSLMLGFNAMKLSLTIASGALVIFNGLVKAAAGGTAGINALAMVFQVLGLQINAANIKAIGFGVTIRALLISTGIGALVVLLGTLAAAFLTVGNNARKAADDARAAVQQIREAAAAGDVATIQMSANRARATLETATALQKATAGMGRGGGRSGKQISVSELESRRGEFATIGMQLPAKGAIGAGKMAGDLEAIVKSNQSIIREANIVGPAAAARRKRMGLDQPTPSPAAPEAPSTKSGGSSKAENAAKRLAEEVARQAQSAADALFNEQQRLTIMQATNPTAKALAEYASQELVIQRELNQALKNAKSEKEKQDRIAEAGFKRQSNALTLDQQLADARKQAMQPLEDALRNQREQLLVEEDIKNLVAQGMVPERAKEVAEIKKLTRAALEQIDAQIQQFSLSIDTAKAALEEAKARGASAQAVADMVKNLDELEKRKKKAEEDRAGAITTGEAAVQGVPTAPSKNKSPRSYIEDAAKSAKEELEKLTNWGFQAVEGAKAIGSAFGQAFKDIASGSMSAQEALANMMQSIADHFLDMAAQIIAQQITMMIYGLILKALGVMSGAAASVSATGPNPGGIPSTGNITAPSVNGFDLGSVANVAANGAVWKGGFQAFANGGMVTGPTLGLIGEGKYNEAIVPLPNGRSIPVQLQGDSIREKMGDNYASSPSSPMLSMTFETTSINGVEYVSRDQLEAAMMETRKLAAREGAQKGANLAIDKLQQSPNVRRRVGMR